MDNENALPESLFRHQLAYRMRGSAGSCAVPGCGFMLKPDKEGEVKDCVMQSYVGVYLLRGEGSYVDWNGKEIPLRPGDLAQRIPGRKHSTLLKPDGLWCEFFFELGRDFYDALQRYGFIDAERPVLHPGLRPSITEKCEALIADMASGSGPVAHETLLKAHELIFELYKYDKAEQAPDPHAGLIEEAKEILGGDLKERMPLPELAARFNLSYERFRKVFKERAGFSPGAFRLRRRVEAACRLLAGGRSSVKEVAFQLGYPNVQSFSKQFSQLTGVSPSTFRERS